MLNNILAKFYERDIRKLIEEVKAFKDEDDLWKTHGSVQNTAGNLVLHIIGGLNYFLGTQLAHTNYIRHRNNEFADKYVKRDLLLLQLEELLALVRQTFASLSSEDMDKSYPIMFDDADNKTGYVLTQLALHLNYHLGQINYLRRMLE